MAVKKRGKKWHFKIRIFGKEVGVVTQARLKSEAERTEIVTFVKTEVLTSYRNGQREGEKKCTPAKTDERPSQPAPKGRPAPTKRRNYQHR